MAQGDGDGIGGIVRFRHGLQMQEPFGHILHLMLRCIAVAHNGLLDLHGLVLKEGDTSLPDGQQDHPPALGHIDAGGNVLAEEQLFDGNHIGLCHPEKLRHIVVDHFQTPGKVRIGRCGNGSAVEQPKLAALGIDETKAGNAVPGVDSQNPNYRPPPAKVMIW